MQPRRRLRCAGLSATRRGRFLQLNTSSARSDSVKELGSSRTWASNLGPGRDQATDVWAGAQEAGAT